VFQLKSSGCNGNASGSIDLSVNGGTSPYTYSWSNGATTQDLNNITGSIYTYAYDKLKEKYKQDFDPCVIEDIL
jgi:hypothetical protein